MTDASVIDKVAPVAPDGFAVQVRDLRMSYGSTEVLRGVDFDVRDGEVFCLLGPNGAGKTTTLEILEGFRRPPRRHGPGPRPPPFDAGGQAPSAAYLGGLLASTVATVIIITACTGLIGWVAFGAGPRSDGPPALIAGLILGIVCFATLGLAISSVIPTAESAGPIAYASFLPIAIISGVFDPTFSGLPQWLSRMVAAFPVKALAQLLQGAYAARPFPAWDVVNLGLWTAVGAAFVTWHFRWHS